MLFAYPHFAALTSMLLAYTLPTTARTSSTIFMITSAETPSLGLPGFSPVGQQRVDICIPSVFGPSSTSNIGLIISCLPNPVSGSCVTEDATVAALATALNLTVDRTCPPNDDNGNDNSCVAQLTNKFFLTSSQNALVSWPADNIDDLIDDLNIDDVPDYPTGHADVVFTIRNKNFISQTSQNCPGIDGESSESVAEFGTTPVVDGDSGSLPAPPSSSSDNSDSSSDGTSDSTTTDSSSDLPSNAEDPAVTATAAVTPTNPDNTSGSSANTVSDLFETLTAAASDTTATAAVDSDGTVDPDASGDGLQTQTGRRSMKMRRQLSFLEDVAA